MELLEPLITGLLTHTPNLINNVRSAWMNDSAAAPSGASSLDMRMSCYWDYATEPETGRCITDSPTICGNLLWTLHIVYRAYERTGKVLYLKQMLPLLERAVNFHVHLSVFNPTNISLTTTFSPEYAKGTNINYDLALFR